MRLRLGECTFPCCKNQHKEGEREKRIPCIRPAFFRNMMSIITWYVNKTFRNGKEGRSEARFFECLRVPLLRGFDQELDTFKILQSGLEKLKIRLRWSEDISDEPDSMLLVLAVCDENVEAVKEIIIPKSKREVSEMLSCKISFNFFSHMGVPDGCTPLHFACLMNASSEIVQLLLSRGANPKIKTSDLSLTSFDMCCISCSSNIINFWLKKMSPSSNDLNKALCVICFLGSGPHVAACIDVLLDSGASVHTSFNKFGILRFSLLHLMIMNDDLDIKVAEKILDRMFCVCVCVYISHFLFL